MSSTLTVQTLLKAPDGPGPCGQVFMPPGSGYEPASLSHQRNGVMTYSHYVNGSIFSVPKFEVVAKTNVQGTSAKANSDNLVESVYGLVKSFLGASGTNQGAIDNRIEQAMDLVKSHLMNAVRSEVEELKEKIIKLEETISTQEDLIAKHNTDFNRAVGKLQAENDFLRNHVAPDVLVQLSNIQTTVVTTTAPVTTNAVAATQQQPQN